MINDFLNDICAEILGFTPELKRCETHAGRFDLGELQKIATRTPAVFVGWLGSPLGDPQGGIIDADLNLVAYVITGDSRLKSRGQAANDIVKTLITNIPGRQWGNPEEVSPAVNLVCENMYNGKIGRHGVAMWAVAWRQVVRLNCSCN